MIKGLMALVASIVFLNNLCGQTALHFNGVNNLVQTTGAPVLNNQSRTVDAWINTTFTPTTQIVICDWGTFSPLGSRFTLNVTTNRLRIEVGGIGLTGNQLVNTGQWMHVTAVYESSITSGNNVFLYVNGVLDAAGTFTGYPVLTTTNATNLRIGSRVDGINLFNGAIDELKVYNYARTAAQIAADTVEYCAPLSGLVAYYKLNEGIPNALNTGSVTALDYSGNGNNGVLNSFTLSGTSSNWVPGRVRQNAPIINASPAASVCSGNSLSLSASTANSFTWSTGNSSSTLITITPTISGVYSISVTTNQNCVAFSTLAVTVSNGLPTLSVSTLQNPICLGAATALNASGALTYTWSNGIVNAQNFSPSVTTTYSLTAANACGSVNAVRTITVVPLSVTVAASSATVCQGSTASLSASASANSYTWQPGSLSGSIAIISPAISTVYTVSASDGTCRGTTTIQIQSVISPTVSLPSTAFICEGQSYTVQASSTAAGGSFSWSPSGGNSNVAIINPTTTSAYTVVSTNSLGCSGSAQIVMVVTSQPSFNVIASKTLLCEGQSATLTASGAGTYTWNNGPASPTTIVSPSSPSVIYSVTATAATNSCTATKTIEIRVFTPTISATSAVSVCIGSSVSLSASGAASYSWNGTNSPGGTLGITPTLSTTYTLTTISTSLNTTCGASRIATITVFSLPTLTAVASATHICRTFPTVLLASGASSYTWLAINQTTPQVSVIPLTNTTYTVIGSDNNGCQNTATVAVKVSPTCAGIEDQDNLRRIQLFPNPASQLIYIKSEIPVTGQIKNLNGQIILSFTCEAGNSAIGLDAINPGLYFIVLESDGNSATKKILVE